jgi:tetratricopeptide (TPR) repeat protein
MFTESSVDMGASLRRSQGRVNGRQIKDGRSLTSHTLSVIYRGRLIAWATAAANINPISHQEATHETTYCGSGRYLQRIGLVDQLGRDGERCYAPQGASGSKAEGHLTEGIEHFEKEHWDVAKKHFTEGAKADPPSAEVHYDVALVLDKMGDHTGATEHFKKGLRARKEQSDIQNSGLLKKHLKM